MLKAIDFFCGGGGMTYGLSEAGIHVLAGIDIDINCKETYEFNNTNSVFLHRDIKNYKITDLALDINIKPNDDSMIFVGCSPCQYWSIINTNKDKSSKSKDLLAEFGRFVEYYLPGYVLVENVPGILKKENESPLRSFIIMLEKNNYKFDYHIVNMNNYGVPQNRKRFSLIASRIAEVKLPKPDNNTKVLKDYIGQKNGFLRIEAGHKDNSDFNHSCAGLSELNLERIRKTKHNGGCRFDWKEDNKLQLNAYCNNDNDFRDNYGRMSWDKPAPTITTKFLSLSNGRFGHPEEDRALSVREGATLQTFPKSYVFKSKSLGQIAKIIGNAVPPEFAKRLGESINNKNVEIL